MKILIVSDTHGSDYNLERVLMRESPFDIFVHCGDVEDREDYIESLLECPAHIVAGNNDYYSNLRQEESFTAGKNRFFVTHGHNYGVSWDMDKVVSAAISRNCNVVLFGHSHRPMIEKIDGVLCMNPGSLTYPRQNGRKPSYITATVDPTGELHAEIQYLLE